MEPQQSAGKLLSNTVCHRSGRAIGVGAVEASSDTPRLWLQQAAMPTEVKPLSDKEKSNSDKDLGAHTPMMQHYLWATFKGA